MPHYLLFHIPHGSLDALFRGHSSFSAVDPLTSLGPTAALSLCAVVDDALSAGVNKAPYAAVNLDAPIPSGSAPPTGDEQLPPMDLREYSVHLERQVEAFRIERDRMMSESGSMTIERERLMARVGELEAHATRVEELVATNARLEARNAALDARNAGLEARNAELEASCAQLTTSSGLLSASRDELAETRDALEDAVTKKQIRVDELENAVRALEASQLERQRRVDELEASNTQLEATNVQLEGSNTRLQETMMHLEATNTQLQTTNTQLEASNTQLQNGTIAQLQTTIAQLRVTKDEWQERLKKAVKMYKELTVAKEEADTAILRLQALNHDLEGKLHVAEGRAEELGATNERQKTRLQSLASDLDNSKAETTELKSEIGQLQADHSRLVATNGDLVSEITTLKTAIQFTREENEELAVRSAQLDTSREEHEGFRKQLEKSQRELADNARTIADLQTVSDQLRSDAETGRTEVARIDALVQTLIAERDMARAQIVEVRGQLAEAYARAEDLRDPILASDDDVLGVVGELNAAIRRIGEDIAANVTYLEKGSESTDGHAGVVHQEQATVELRAWVGESVCGVLVHGEAEARRAVLPLALQSTIARWVRGMVGRWSLDSDEENDILRRLYSQVVERHDPLVAGRWRATTLRAHSRADSLCASLETSLLRSLSAVLAAARFRPMPRDGAEALETAVETLVWKALEIREHLGIVVTDRELALVQLRTTEDRALSAEGATESASRGNVVDANGTMVRIMGGEDAEDACPAVLGLVRYQGTIAVPVLQSHGLSSSQMKSDCIVRPDL